jgi:hypothetical protein
MRGLLAERAGGGGDCRDSSADRTEKRGHVRDLIRDRLEGRNDLRDLFEDRMRSREDMRDLLADRMERRALLRELLSEHMQNRGGAAGDHVSNRFEGADENMGGTGGINREDLRDLILDRIRNRGEVDQLLEQIHDRIGGEE